MKKLLTLAIALTIALTASAQNYTKMWQEVEEYKKKDLPKSAETAAWNIYDKSKRKGNFCQQVKSLASLLDIRSAISPDSAESVISLMEGLLQDKSVAKSATDKAIVHAVLANSYSSMRNNAMRNGDTYEKCDSIAAQHQDSALCDFDVLSSTSSKQYKPLMRIFKQDSRIYDNDMLSVLTGYIAGNANLDKEKEYSLYASLTDYYSEKGNRNAALLMRLSALDRQLRLWDSPNRISRENLRDSLLTLARSNRDIETGADAYWEAWNYADKSDDNFLNSLALINEAIEAFPNSVYTGKFKTERANLIRPRLTATAFKSTHSPVDIKLHYYDVNTCRITFFHKGRQAIETAKTIALPKTDHPADFKTSFNLAPGDYRMTVQGGTLSDTTDVHITTLMATGTALADRKALVTVVDGASGSPISNDMQAVSVSVKEDRSTLTKRYTTDAHGQLIATTKERRADFTIDAGNYNTTSFNLWNSKEPSDWKNAPQSDDIKFHTYIFTDRSIYRPGHTVKGSVMVYKRTDYDAEVYPNLALTLILQQNGRNGKEIARQEITTNTFGTASFEFVIPEGAEPGSYRFSIREDADAHGFIQVEEYKRPTFFVETELETERYTIGDTVIISGKAQTFSGVPVQDARIQYRLQCRNSAFIYRIFGSWTDVKTDTLRTDGEGKFSVSVPLNASDFNHGSRLLEYRLSADVTNTAGETQQGETSIRIARTTFDLTADVPAIVETAKGDNIMPRALNTNGKPLTVSGEYILRQIVGKDTTEVLRSSFTSGQGISTDILSPFTPGSYEIELRATDTHKDIVSRQTVSDTISTRHEFILFSPKAKTMNVGYDFIHTSAEHISADQPVDLYYMPSQKDINLYWLIMCEDSILERGMKSVRDEMQHMHFDYKAEYGDGLSVTFFYVKDFQLHQTTKRIELARPDKALTLKWKTFRNRLTPGQQEEWTLSITDSKGKPVAAELIASMYDASLDKIQKHGWWFNLYFPRNIDTPYFITPQHSAWSTNISLDFPVQKFETLDRRFDYLDIPAMASPRGFVTLAEVPLRLRGTKANAALSAPVSADMQGRIAGLDVVSTSAKVADKAEGASMYDAVAEAEEEANSSLFTFPSSLRKDFSESAFFLPHLLTSKKGEARISFTLPESTTEWKFMGFAHTADMKYGSITDKATASKEFMVVPNMPRFIRMGDSAAITTSIINRSDKTVSGNISITLIDPETEKTIITQVLPFSVEAKQTGTATFFIENSSLFTFPSSLICQIEAESEKFSDGERHLLPVLSDKQLITRTIPFFMSGKGEKTIDISKIFNDGSATATDRRLSIQYDTNPALGVMEALNDISIPENDNAISLSAAYFAILAKEKVKVKSEESLKEKGKVKSEESATGRATRTCHPEPVEGSNSSLLTPNSSLRESLLSLQNPDGSWSWFEGMRGSTHVTATVVEHIAELECIIGKECDLHAAMLKGMEWLDEKELEHYNKQKESAKNQLSTVNYQLPESTLRYLYISSLVSRPLSAEVKAMQDEYLDKAEKMVRDLTIYGRANIACALAANDRKQSTHDFVQSLREYTVYKPEFGRYYDSPKAHYSWCDYRMPTHLAAMKAMRLAETDFTDSHTYLNEMTLWILQQKRVQKWDNPINTIGAVCTLLEREKGKGKSEESTTSSATRICHPIHRTCHPEPVEGSYVIVLDSVPSTSLRSTQDDIVQKNIAKENTAQPIIHHQLSIVNCHFPLVWGAVYGQCMEKTANIHAAANTEISITQKLYVERIENGKSVWVEAPKTLKVGDKVRIRYTLTTDRDMDFIRIKAQHAACLESLDQLSGYRWLGTAGAYVAHHDSSCDYFFDTFRKGSMTIDREMYVTRPGTYSMGIATAECTYCTDFAAHSESMTITVE